jgi:hypothetical protein
VKYNVLFYPEFDGAFVDDAELKAPDGLHQPRLEPKQSAYTGGSYEILDSDCRNNVLYVRRSAR